VTLCVFQIAEVGRSNDEELAMEEDHVEYSDLMDFILDDSAPTDDF
jgi:hypothetical protein